MVLRGSVFDILETVVCACADHSAMMMMQDHNNKDANPNLAILIRYDPFTRRKFKSCINVQNVAPFVFQQRREENRKPQDAHRRSPCRVYIYVPLATALYLDLTLT